MKKTFLDIKIGDKVIVFDEYAHDYVEHILIVESIEYHENWITETNPKGMHCFGTDLQEDEYGDDYITQIHEGNFCRIVEERERLWVCDRCLSIIEDHNGIQARLPHDVDETNIEESMCDWCNTVGFEVLDELI